MCACEFIVTWLSHVVLVVVFVVVVVVRLMQKQIKLAVACAEKSWEQGKRRVVSDPRKEEVRIYV